MPWLMMVDSRATTGVCFSRACLTASEMTSGRPPETEYLLSAAASLVASIEDIPYNIKRMRTDFRYRSFDVNEIF